MGLLGLLPLSIKQETELINFPTPISSQVPLGECNVSGDLQKPSFRQVGRQMQRPQEESSYRTPLVSNHTSKQLPVKPQSPNEVWHPDTAAGWRESLAEVKGRPTSTVAAPGHADPNGNELTCFKCSNSHVPMLPG